MHLDLCMLTAQCARIPRGPVQSAPVLCAIQLHLVSMRFQFIEGRSQHTLEEDRRFHMHKG